MEEQPRPRHEKDLPPPAPESGMPGGGSSIAGGKAPHGTSETEDVRENVTGGPAEETHGAVAPDDEHGSKAGASAAMRGDGEDSPDEQRSPNAP